MAAKLHSLFHTTPDPASFSAGTAQRARRMARSLPFWLCVAAVIVLAYGFTLTNPSVSIDDTALDRYFVQADVLLQGHFTLFLINLVLPMLHFQAISLDFLAVLLMAAAGLVFTAAFYQAAPHWDERFAPVFPCLFLSYSLICEIFIYMENTVDIGLGYLLAALALVLSADFVFGRAAWDGRVTLAAVCLCFAAGTYETMLIVCLTGVLCLWFLQLLRQPKKATFSDCLGVCLRSGLTAFVGLVLWAVIGQGMKLLYSARLAGHVNASENGINWLNEGFSGLPRKILGFFAYLFLDFLLPVLCLLPIRELILCMLALLIAGAVAARRRGQPMLLLCAVLLCAVQFALGALQGPTEDGVVQPYRVCQSFALLVAFVGLLGLQWLAGRPRRAWGVAGTVLAVYLVLLQCYDLNSWFWADHQRWEYEKGIVQQVGWQLAAQFDTSEKPVVFAGEIELPQSLVQRKYAPDGGAVQTVADRVLQLGGKEVPEHYSYMQTMLLSVINWSVTAWYDQAPNEQTYELFAMQGFEYQPCTLEQYLEGREKATELPQWPAEGSLSDQGDYLLVNF